MPSCSTDTVNLSHDLTPVDPWLFQCGSFTCQPCVLHISQHSYSSVCPKPLTRVKHTCFYIPCTSLWVENGDRKPRLHEALAEVCTAAVHCRNDAIAEERAIRVQELTYRICICPVPIAPCAYIFSPHQPEAAAEMCLPVSASSSLQQPAHWKLAQVLPLPATLMLAVHMA